MDKRQARYLHSTKESDRPRLADAVGSHMLKATGLHSKPVPTGENASRSGTDS